jgi:hypothetical protein
MGIAGAGWRFFLCYDLCHRGFENEKDNKNYSLLEMQIGSRTEQRKWKMIPK